MTSRHTSYVKGRNVEAFYFYCLDTILQIENGLGVTIGFKMETLILCLKIKANISQIQSVL